MCHKNRSAKFLAAEGALMLSAVAVTVICIGCQSQSNPWVGKQYQEPTGYSNPPQSIYAPMPTILPSIDGTAMETDATLESELDLLINQDESSFPN